MSGRVMSIFLAAALGAAALSPGAAAAAGAKAGPRQDRGIMLDQSDDDNPYTDGFAGGYWTGGQYVSVDAYSVESDTYYVPTSDGGWEERVDFYYSDGAQIKSGGSTLAYTTYELDRPSNYSIMHVTLGGVTLTYNLDTQEAYPISDSDRDALYQWLASADGGLARETSAALLDQGYQPTDVWMGHAATAMLLAPGEEDQAASKRPEVRRGTVLASAVGRLKSRLGLPAVAGFVRPCSADLSGAPVGQMNLLGAALRPAAAGAPAQGGNNCYGCCGPGCHCIRDRRGQPIYSSACAAHDSCIRAAGYVLGSVGCGYLLTASIVVVVARAAPRILIVRR